MFWINSHFDSLFSAISEVPLSVCDIVCLLLTVYCLRFYFHRIEKKKIKQLDKIQINNLQLELIQIICNIKCHYLIRHICNNNNNNSKQHRLDKNMHCPYDECQLNFVIFILYFAWVLFTCRHNSFCTTCNRQECFCLMNNSCMCTNNDDVNVIGLSNILTDQIFYLACI